MAELFFEGVPVTETDGRIPAIKVVTPEAYKRGTILRLTVEVRVKNVRLEENRDGGLTRSHVFAVESINVDEAYDPSQVASQLMSSGPGEILTNELANDLVKAVEEPPVQTLGQLPGYVDMPPGTIPDYPARTEQVDGQTFLTNDGDVLPVVPTSTDERLNELEEVGFF